MFWQFLLFGVIGTALIHLGTLSVWVTVLTLPLKVILVLAVGIGLLYFWRKWLRISNHLIWNQPWKNTMTITLLAVSLLCLAFNNTRLFGVGGITVLFYLHPPLLIGTLILGGFYWFLTHKWLPAKASDWFSSTKSPTLSNNQNMSHFIVENFVCPAFGEGNL